MRTQYVNFCHIILKWKISNTEAFEKFLCTEGGSQSVYRFYVDVKQKTPKLIRVLMYSRRDLNPHAQKEHRILSPACLPFHHSSIDERETGFEPATPTLARSCSTNWATFAIWVGSEAFCQPRPRRWLSSERTETPCSPSWIRTNDLCINSAVLYRWAIEESNRE